jgi:MFS family permease
MSSETAAQPEPLLRNRNFVLLALARISASLATFMQSVAVGWLVYDLTGDPFALGLVGLAEFLPAFGLVAVTGIIVDRFNRKKVAAFAVALETLTAAILLGSVLSGQATPMIVYIASLIFGVGRAFAMPSQQALLPNLVAPASLSRAVAIMSTAFQVSVIAGPALGGLLFIFGAEVVFAVNVVLLAMSVMLLLAIRMPARLAQGKQPVTWGTALAGFRYVKSQPIVFGAISLDLFAVLFGGATALLPVFAKDILHTGPEGLGLLRSAPAVGATIVALILTRFPLGGRVGHKLFVSVGLFGLATIVFGVSTNFWLSLGALAVLGAADEVSVVVRSTVIQLATPDEMRGRVSAVNSIFIGASNQLGEFESGVTAAWFGTELAVIIGGLGTLLVTVLWIFFFRPLYDADTFESIRAKAESRQGAS